MIYSPNPYGPGLRVSDGPEGDKITYRTYGVSGDVLEGFTTTYKPEEWFDNKEALLASARSQIAAQATTSYALLENLCNTLIQEPTK